MARFDHMRALPFTIEKSVRMTDSGRPRLDIEGWASTEALDCYDEVIEVGFFDDSLPAFMRRPLMPWMHDIRDIQGKWTSIEPVKGQGYRVAGYLVDFGTDEDKKRLGLVEEGMVSSLSVGFSGDWSDEYGYTDKATGAWHWTQNGVLHEVSLVPLPANPETDFEVSRSLGWDLAKRPSNTPKEVAEEQRFLDDLERLRGASISVSNYARHLAKASRELTAPNRTMLAEAHAALAAILEPYPGEPPRNQSREPNLGSAGAGVFSQLNEQAGAPSGLTLPRVRSIARG